MAKHVLILDNVRSAHNVGSILRTADGLGAAKVFLCGTTPYPKMREDNRLPHIQEKVHQRITKTALGAEASVAWLYKEETGGAIAACRDEGYRIVAVEQTPQSISLQHFREQAPCAFILGNEVEGISPHVLKMCDLYVEIPMLGSKESFNVSVTSALVLWQAQTFDNEKASGILKPS